jgi:hypothetical protein
MLLVMTAVVCTGLTGTDVYGKTGSGRKKSDAGRERLSMSGTAPAAMDQKAKVTVTSFLVRTPPT